MRILCALQELPYPPNNGISCKCYCMISALLEEFECDVIAFGTESDRDAADEWQRKQPGLRVLDIINLPNVPALKLRQIAHLVFGTAMPSEIRYKSVQFARALRNAVMSNSYDLIHLDIINMLQYSNVSDSIPIVFSPNDAMSLRFKRLAEDNKGTLARAIARRQIRVVENTERKQFPKLNAVHVVSPIDYDYYCKKGYENVTCIPNSVDDSYFEIPLLDGKEKETITIFTGAGLNTPYLYKPISRFVREYWPSIKEEVPAVNWLVVGRDAPVEADLLFGAHEGVKLVRWVEDYAGCLAGCDICLFLDGNGTGLKNRVLNAIAAGRPVVGTDYALEGIAIENGVHGFLVRNHDEARERLLELVKSPALRKQMGDAAREMAQRHYTRKVVGGAWKQFYKQVIDDAALGRQYKGVRA